VQVWSESARNSIAVQVLCRRLCLILLSISSYLLESCHPDHFFEVSVFHEFGNFMPRMLSKLRQFRYSKHFKFQATCLLRRLMSEQNAISNNVCSLTVSPILSQLDLHFQDDKG